MSLDGMTRLEAHITFISPGCRTNDHRPGGLEQQKFLFPAVLETGSLKATSLCRIQVWAGPGPLGEKEL